MPARAALDHTMAKAVSTLGGIGHDTGDTGDPAHRNTGDDPGNTGRPPFDPVTAATWRELGHPGDPGHAAHATGVHTASYVGDGSDDAEQAWFDARFHAIVTDLVGTPTELVNPGGDIAWHARTSLWGASPPPLDGDIDCPLRFPGQYHDPETGLHYNYHRHYDPTTARYTSTDPLGLTPALNPHIYVPNPTHEFDPLGLAPYSIKQRMRAAGPGTEFGLPSRGRIRYLPPEGYNPATPLPRGPQGGYIDRFGNEWVVGPSRTPGHPFEWDVQLSNTGREQLGWLTRDGSHANVSPLGEVTHR
jgi:RHS repeat-associated protein